MKNPFRPGCYDYIVFEVKKNDDIRYVTYDETEYPILIKIIVKPNYNIGKIINFKNYCVPLGIYSEIIVEENYNDIKYIKKGD